MKAPISYQLTMAVNIDLIFARPELQIPFIQFNGSLVPTESFKMALSQFNDYIVLVNYSCIAREECNSGHRCSYGFRHACEPGYSQGDRYADICGLCGNGEFSNETGAIQCLACEKGKFQPGIGASSCELCSVGFYQDKPRQAQCKWTFSGSFGWQTPVRHPCKRLA